MAEQRKTWHGEVVPFAHLVDEQIAQWPAMRVAVPPPPEKVLVETRPAGKVKPELVGLFDPPNEREERLRGAFVAFLEHTEWRCDTCDGRVDKDTLKVPPPTIRNGVIKFRMYCSDTCAALHD